MIFLTSGSGTFARIDKLEFGLDLDNDLTSTIGFNLNHNTLSEEISDLIINSELLNANSEIIARNSHIYDEISAFVGNYSGTIVSGSSLYTNILGSVFDTQYTTSNTSIYFSNYRLLASGTINLTESNPGVAGILLKTSWQASADTLGATSLTSLAVRVNYNQIIEFKNLLTTPKYSIVGKLTPLIIPFDANLLISGTNSFELIANFDSSISLYAQTLGSNKLAIDLYQPDMAAFSMARVERFLPCSISVDGGLKDLSGTIRTTTPKDLSSSITIARQDYSYLSGTISVESAYTHYLPAYIRISEDKDFSGTITTTYPATLSGTITTFRPFEDFSGTITVIIPSDLECGLAVIPEFTNDLSSSITIVKAHEYLSGTISTSYPQDLSGTITVYPYEDLSSSISTISINDSDLNCSINVLNLLKDLSGTINTLLPVDLNSSITTLSPIEDFSGTIAIMPYSDLSGTIIVERNSNNLSGTISTNNYGERFLSGTISTDKYLYSVSGTLITSLSSVNDVSGTISVAIERKFKDINSAIIVLLPGNKLLDSLITVAPYGDLGSQISVVRPSEDLSGTISTSPRFDQSIDLENFYSYDKFSNKTITQLTLISGSGTLDKVLLNITDPEYSLDLIEILKPTGTDTVIINASEQANYFQFSGENVNWHNPIQITDNTLTENDYSLPSVTRFGDKIYLSYSQNFNNKLKRTIVLKSEDNYNWSPSNLYKDSTGGQFLKSSSGTDMNAEMAINYPYGWVKHPGPKKDESNDFFKSEIIFKPESYDIDGTIYDHLWITLQYQMQANGIMEYPAPQWEENPIKESINSSIDNFDPIPKHANDIIIGDGGYYQDFDNSFTGGG